MLLILAGVALATLTGQGNIIGNAENAVDKYNNSVASEQQLLNEIEKYFQNYLGGENGDTQPTPPDPVEPPKVNENGLAIENITIKPDENSDVQIVIPAGFAPVILKGSNSTYSLPGQDGSVKEIMPAEQWYSITAEQINQGIVIVDNAITYTEGIPDFNEYVWVPIGENKEFSRTSWITPYGFNENGVWQNGNCTTPHQLSDSTAVNKWCEEVPNQMKDSLDLNKGFYIGRYEASQNNNIAQSKRGQIVWTNISQLQAIEAAKNSNISHMHLMYGTEYDSILNWLIGNATISSNEEGKTKIVDINDIQTNSRSWGNYVNSTGDAAKEPWTYNTKQNTGKSEYWKANNIYDIAGNVDEWTQEGYSTGIIRAGRGGNCSSGGDGYPAAFRHYHNADNNLSATFGFRISFYI